MSEIQGAVRNTLPDARLLHPLIFKEYKKAHEEIFVKRNDAGVWLQSSNEYEIKKGALRSKLKVTHKTPGKQCT